MRAAAYHAAAECPSSAACRFVRNINSVLRSCSHSAFDTLDRASCCTMSVIRRTWPTAISPACVSRKCADAPILGVWSALQQSGLFQAVHQTHHRYRLQIEKMRTRAWLISD